MPRGRPRKIVQDSSPLPPTVHASSPSRSSRSETFQGVLIPSDKMARKKNKTSISTTSSTPSAVDSMSVTDDYDTPATSGAATPATDLRSSGKRKRPGRSSLNSTITLSADRDAALAQALQEEEYNIDDDEDEDESPPIKSSTKRRSIIPNSDPLADSDDEELDDEQDSPSYDSSSDDDVPLAKRRKITVPAARKGKKTAASSASASRPGRRAGATAKKAVRTIVDSDESELSDIASNFSDDDVSDVEAADVEAEDEAASDLAGNGSLAQPALDSPPPYQSTAQRRRLQRGRRNGKSHKARQRERLEKSHPSIKTMWDDLKKVPKIVTAEAEQPETINRALKSFQLEGLHWMQEQEKTQWKGGLLGDEMGMGKTIQAVSLIMSDYPAKQPTLVVVPPVALMQWSNEIGDYTNGKLKVLVYHGTNSKSKNLSVKELRKFDVIMISYAGLESVHRKETKGWTRGDKIVKEDSAIHSINFHRLILDEAHSIKSRQTGVAKACFALKGTYKWCLSGTPVQNRIGEFFSLLRFLEVSPFANYYCKACPCSSLHWTVDKTYKCTLCGHRQLDHVSVFNQEILNPITDTNEDSTDATRKAAFGKLRMLTDRIMLRRMKRDYTASMELPPKEIVIHNEFFGEIERDFANSIMGGVQREFDTYVSRGVMLDNYANIFGLIMQMRQVADHPDLITKKRSEGGQNILVCNICDEPAEGAIRSKCKHEFCRSCAKDFVKTCDNSGAAADCPRCHISLSIDFDQPDIEQDEDGVKSSSIINRIKMENWTSSTKIEMLVYDLWKLRSKKQTTKSIVFSQFTSMLQLVEWRLRRAGFNTVMLDGSMSPAQRQKSIDHFMNNTDVEVFLVSLKAGGVALNLTEASRVFIIDPWWNPAAEWQSADRCHRIGQKRPCVITRLCVEDSIESRIVMLQEKKAHMINSTVNGDETVLDKLTPQDMQFLFRGS